jgi:hypothetical protein
MATPVRSRSEICSERLFRLAEVEARGRRSSKQRIEAVEIGIAIKDPGIKDILVDEGEFSGRGGKLPLGVQATTSCPLCRC